MTATTRIVDKTVNLVDRKSGRGMPYFLIGVGLVLIYSAYTNETVPSLVRGILRPEENQGTEYGGQTSALKPIRPTSTPTTTATAPAVTTTDTVTEAVESTADTVTEAVESATSIFSSFRYSPGSIF